MKRIVIKLGTGVLSHLGGRALDRAQFERLSAEIAELIQHQVQCILVSSGAIAAGVSVLQLAERPTDLPGKQACAAAGQPLLMQQFDEYLRTHHLHAAQLLLTHSDIDSTLRRNNVRRTLDRLLAAQNVVPIFNENDSVSIEELSLGDNDRLSAEVAILAEADLLLILTTAEGLMEGPRLITEVTNIPAAFQHITGEKGPQSTGGMFTKLEAMHIATQAGVAAIIASGHKPGLLKAAVIDGLATGTFFPAQEKRLQSLTS